MFPMATAPATSKQSRGKTVCENNYVHSLLQMRPAVWKNKMWINNMFLEKWNQKVWSYRELQICVLNPNFGELFAQVWKCENGSAIFLQCNKNNKNIFFSCTLTLAAESSASLVPPSSGKSGAVGTETGSRGERALPAWPSEAVFTWGFGRLAPGQDRQGRQKVIIVADIWLSLKLYCFHGSLLNKHGL